MQLEKNPKPSEVIIPKDNLDVSVFNQLVSCLASVTPEQILIPLGNKSKETLAVSIVGQEPIQKQ